jgi:hypothetical protein
VLTTNRVKQFPATISCSSFREKFARISALFLDNPVIKSDGQRPSYWVNKLECMVKK